MAKQLKHLIPHLMKPQEEWQLILLSNWSSIVGNLSSRVCLEKIQGDTLILGVYDACWMQELYMLSGLLIDTINKSLDQPRIKNLRFKRIMSRAQKKNTVLEQEPSDMVQIILTPREQKALNAINDPQLRQALQQFLFRCHKEKKL